MTGPRVSQEPDYVASYLKLYAQPPATVQVTIPMGSQASGQPIPAFRNNNPGNLQFAGQQGASQGDGAWAKFDSPEAGYQALVKQIQLDQSRGLPLGAFIAKYAPPFENDTAKYVTQISAAMGVDPGTPLSHIPVGSLAAFVAHKESGSTVKNALPSSPMPAVLAPQGNQPSPQYGTPPAAMPNQRPGGGASF